jgi:hypothetical protein
LGLGRNIGGSIALPGECDWSETSYAALKSLLENSLDESALVQALMRIATLEKPPYVADEALVKAWTDLAKDSTPSADSCFNTLVKSFEEIGCAADGSPYVIGGLVRRSSGNRVQLDDRFEDNLSQAAEVAAAFLDNAECRGARAV